MRSGNVHALGSRTRLEDKTLVADEEVELEGLITIALVCGVHEVDELVGSLCVVGVVSLERYGAYNPIAGGVVVERRGLANDDGRDTCLHT